MLALDIINKIFEWQQEAFRYTWSIMFLNTGVSSNV